MKYSLILLPVFFLTACTNSNNFLDKKSITSADAAGRISECIKEINALKKINPQDYEKYQMEYVKIKKETEKYLAVKNDLGEDLNYLLMPQYQFSIRYLCHKVKTSLSDAMVNKLN